MAADVEDTPSRLLLVDDNADMLSTVRRSLRSAGYDITATTSSVDACDLLRQREFDLILSDVDMPHVTGHDLMALARQVQPHAVRILLTGRATYESALRAINEGEVHRFVGKPFEPPVLRSLVAEGLARQKELGLVAEASQRAQRRRLLFQHLEAEHPGISMFERDAAGAYLHDPVRTKQVAAQLGLDPLL